MNDRSNTAKLSVIIPVYRDESMLGRLLAHLSAMPEFGQLEVIVVNGEPEEMQLTARYPSVTFLCTDRPCRAVQMNAGARTSKSDILFFVHADALPPRSFPADIDVAIQNGHPVGSYRLRLEPRTAINRINSFFSRYRTRFSGGGDQTLYLPRVLFEQMGGYNEAYCIMEDFELVDRLAMAYGYYIIPRDVIVSARKYDWNSHWRVNIANYRAFRMYRNGAAPEAIRAFYESSLRIVRDVN